jgi:hypothetical protein
LLHTAQFRMIASQLLLISLLPLVQAQETILGAFVLHRHGDRTTKSWPPARLTDLGYSQVYEDGTWYRNRYVTSSSSSMGLEQNVVKLSQLSVQAPVDIVLQAAAIGWLQGLYPPVGPQIGSQILANGSTIEAPLNGYQLIPVNQVGSVVTSSNLENTVWLQGSSGCENAIISSNNYFISEEYITTEAETEAFYQSIYPVVNGSFASSYVNYKNAYAGELCTQTRFPLDKILIGTVYDLINVATIDNTTINSSSLLTPDVLFQLRTRADQHEFGLAYNASDPIRAISGATLAAQILQALNQTVYSTSAPKLNVQFAAYASFLSFFGLAQLPSVSVNFTCLVNYTSSMAFELVTNSTVSSSSYPTPDDISVRFMFSNGSAATNGGLTAYPLFGQSETTLPWSNFSAEIAKIAIGDQATWCNACGNTTGVCATSTSPTNGSGASSSASATPSTSSSSGSGISTAVGGVIGAMVTLAVVLGIEALILLVGGIRLVRKKSLAAASEAGAAVKA